ncbi:MAG: exopolysaccharide biosynthesis polyprenyl glycosylphosphotransferase [Brevundimonas sp.]|uniref:exopolysaccharide biosynthesis polyprenyl glycosylphosphotransferase n=1 Tax=Brevundimonas sp. TaxID=1871086 RepID=UPI00391D11EA
MPASRPRAEACPETGDEGASRTRPRLDAHALQALAARLVTEPGAREKTAPSDQTRQRLSIEARRGPFRPGAWASARERQSVYLAAHYFRALDTLAVIALTLLALAYLSGAPELLDARLAAVLPLFAGAATVLAMSASLGVYRFTGRERTRRHLAKLLLSVASGLALACMLWLARPAALPLSGVLIWGAVLALCLTGLHGIWNARVGRWRRQGLLSPNVVIVGATGHAQRLIDAALKRRDINVLGIFDDRLARSPDSVSGVPVLGDVDTLMGHRMIPYVDSIVLAVDPAARGRVREIAERLSALPNSVSMLIDSPDGTGADEALRRLADTPLASMAGRASPDQRAFHKRVQDLIVGMVMLLALAPVMAVIALLIRLDGPGPIFFRQRRHGFNNEEIVVWKFRTMRPESADARAERQVTADDERITRVGRVLRKTSLDELPQLFNVLSGEMSLVGPRPHAIGMKTGETESARLVADYAHRHRIKPGMTGWAAIKGSRGPLHSAQDVRRRVQLDVEYIERQSLWLDLYVLAMTAPVLLGDRAAVR